MRDIMMESNLEDFNYPRTKYLSIWFAKARVFLGFEENDLKFATHMSAENKENGVSESDSEYCSVQYYDVFPKVTFPIDRIKTALNCVRLRSDRKEGVVSKRSASRSFWSGTGGKHSKTRSYRVS